MELFLGLSLPAQQSQWSQRDGSFGVLAAAQRWEADGLRDVPGPK